MATYTVTDLDSSGKPGLTILGNWAQRTKVLVVNNSDTVIRLANNTIDLLISSKGQAGGVYVGGANPVREFDWIGPMYAMAGELPPIGGLSTLVSVYDSSGVPSIKEGKQGLADPSGIALNLNDPFGMESSDDSEEPADLGSYAQPTQPFLGWNKSAKPEVMTSKCAFQRPSWWPKSWSW